MPRCFPSASGRNCSAGPTAAARAGRSRPSRLGGYVKFLGDNDATSATPSDEPLSSEQQRRAFFSQPLYARAAVVLGGPAANLLFAFLLLTAVFFFAGEPYSPADGRGAGRRSGGQGRSAHGRRDRAPGRQAHRSLRGHPGVAVPLLGQADGGRVPARQPAPATARSCRNSASAPTTTTTRCASANSAWTSSSARWSAASRRTARPRRRA